MTRVVIYDVPTELSQDLIAVIVVKSKPNIFFFLFVVVKFYQCSENVFKINWKKRFQLFFAHCFYR